MRSTPDLQPAIARLLLRYILPLGILGVAAILTCLLPLIGSIFSDIKMYVFISILAATVLFALYFSVRLFTEKVIVTENTITVKHFFKCRSILISEISTAEITDNTNIYAVDANRTAGSVVSHLLGCSHRITFTDNTGKRIVIEPVNMKKAQDFLQQIEQLKIKLR